MVYDLKYEKFSVAMTETIDVALRGHLVRADGDEDLCFALYKPSNGKSRFTGLLNEIIYPNDFDRNIHGNVSFNPSFYDRVIELAVKNQMGIAFLHSHPLGAEWQGMSKDDSVAESSMAGAVFAMTNLPLVGLTLSGQTGFWSGRIWTKTQARLWKHNNCENVRVVGKNLRIDFCPEVKPATDSPPTLERTVNAWGENVQRSVSGLRAGIVGLGSVGSIVAESLARIGVSDVTLIDYDTIKQVNLDRTLNAYKEDVEDSKLKVDICSNAIKRAAVVENFHCLAIPHGIQDLAAYRAILDCDVIFCCVDRPWGRSILNFISYSHLIPIIDGGIAVSKKPNGEMRSAEWGVHVISPGKRCLECIGQYSSGDVALEQDGLLDDPKYIESLPGDSKFRSRENVFLFSMSVAAAEVLSLVQLIGNVSRIGIPGEQRYVFPSLLIQTSTESCHENCSFPQLIAKGEGAGHPNTKTWPGVVSHQKGFPLN